MFVIRSRGICFPAIVGVSPCIRFRANSDKLSLYLVSYKPSKACFTVTSGSSFGSG